MMAVPNLPGAPMRVLRPTLLAIALCACVACDRAPTADTAAPADAAATAPAAPVIGIDLAGIDKSVQPGDDFDQYANGTWRANAEIPADRSSTGIFLQVFQKAEQRTADLVASTSRSARCQVSTASPRRRKRSSTPPSTGSMPATRAACTRRRPSRSSACRRAAMSGAMRWRWMSQ